MGLVTVTLLFVLLLLALVPTRKLWMAGIGLWPRILYLATLLAFGLGSFEVEPLARFLLPIAFLLYLLPLSGLPNVYARWRGRPAPDPGRRARGDGSRIIEGTAVHLDPDEPRTP